MATPEVSHGRGGAGNINPDDTKYVDGEVVRVGAEGSHGDGAFSTGRGGTRQFPPPNRATPSQSGAPGEREGEREGEAEFGEWRPLSPPCLTLSSMARLIGNKAPLKGTDGPRSACQDTASER